MSSGPARHPHIAPVSVRWAGVLAVATPQGVQLSPAQPSTQAQRSWQLHSTLSLHAEGRWPGVEEGSLTASFGSILHHLDPESVVTHGVQHGRSSRDRHVGTEGGKVNVCPAFAAPTNQVTDLSLVPGARIGGQTAAAAATGAPAAAAAAAVEQVR